MQALPLLGQSLTGSLGLTIAGDWLSLEVQRAGRTWKIMAFWASEQRLVLGQVKVEDHSKEITAIPALLELLDITGAIVTIDAMGTQTKIAQEIRDKKADYILSLKANHPTLFSQVKEWFDNHRARNGRRN